MLAVLELLLQYIPTNVLYTFKVLAKDLSYLGAALQIDPRQFYTQLYGALTHLDAREYNVEVM